MAAVTVITLTDKIRMEQSTLLSQTIVQNNFMRLEMDLAPKGKNIWAVRH